jgi:hypothetical protein
MVITKTEPFFCVQIRIYRSIEAVFLEWPLGPRGSMFDKNNGLPRPSEPCHSPSAPSCAAPLEHATPHQTYLKTPPLECVVPLSYSVLPFSSLPPLGFLERKRKIRRDTSGFFFENGLLYYLNKQLHPISA